MKRKILTGLLLIQAFAIFGTDLSEFEANGFPLIIPQVRELKKTEGSFRIPDRFSINAPEGCEFAVGQIRELLRRQHQVKFEKSGLEAVCQLAISQDNTPENPEGYTLKIDSGKIIINSKSTAGLFYGVQTLLQIIRNTPSRELKNCEIVDFPDMEFRAYTISLRGATAENMKDWEKLLDALASVKLNALMVGFEDNFPYTNNPFTLRKQATFTRDDIQKLIDFCRDRHIQIVPCIQVLNHTLWLFSHPDHLDLLEPADYNKLSKWRASYCPSNEKTNALITMMLKEQLEVFKPKYFYIYYDETTQHGVFQKCEKCKARKGVDILSEHLNMVENQLLQAGAYPIIAHDCIRSNTYLGPELAQRVNPKTIIRFWDYGRTLSREDELAEVAALPNKNKIMHAGLGGDPHNVLALSKAGEKYGVKMHSMTRWYHARGDQLDRLTPEMYGGLLLSSSVMWNPNVGSLDKLSYDPVREMRKRMDKKHIKIPAETFTPLGIKSQINAELNRSQAFMILKNDSSLEALKAELNARPEKFQLQTASGGKYYGIVLSGGKDDKLESAPVEIPVDSHLKQLAFLLTTSRPDDMQSYMGQLYGRNTFKFTPVADLTVHYADGQKKRIPIRYRMEVTEFNRERGGWNMRFVNSGFDDRGAFYNLGCFDWINPRPEVKVKSITFSTRQFGGIMPALLAVSATGLNAQPPQGDINFAKAESVPLCKQQPRITPCVDFANGMGKAKVSGRIVKKGGAFGEKLPVAFAIEKDPAAPSGGKVLKITVPPLKNSPDTWYWRVDVELEDYQLRPDSQGLVMTYRMNTAGFSHLTEYLLDTKSKDRNHVLVRREPDTEYQTEFCSFADWDWLKKGVSHFLPGSDKDKVDLRKISFFFKSLPEGANIWIDMIGESPDPCAIYPLRTERRPEIVTRFR